MEKKDLAAAIAVAVIWGANFTVTKLGLGGISPFVLVILRFVLAALPAVFFIRKPDTGLKYIILYGMFVGTGQFVLLFYALSIGMTAGLSSIILQSQAFITPFMAAMFLNERVNRWQITGLIAASSGLLIIASGAGGNNLSEISALAFALTILAALMWSISNIIIKVASKDAMMRGKKLDMFSLVVWSSLVPPIPVYILGKLADPKLSLMGTIGKMNGMSVFSVFYLAFLSTLFGYGLWGYLMNKYPVAKVSPMSLLVPVTGLLTAGIVLGERMSSGQWLGCCIIIAGLFISNFGDRIYRSVIIRD